MATHPSRRILGGLLFYSAGTLAGEAAPQNFDIPAQPLATALDTLARQGNLQLLYADASLKGKRGPAVRGRLNPEQALDRLLAGSGLTYVYTADNTVSVKPEAKPVQLEKVKVSGEAAYDAADPYNPDYNRPNATTATKTDTPIMETPMSIQIVPQQVLKDQQAIRLEDALQNVSGVQYTPSSGNLVDAFVIRGFPLDDTSRFRNGRRFPGFLKSDFANIEQVEVLKGPASVMFGRLEPGGVPNLVTKKPLNQPYYALQQQFGSYDFYRTTVDATGPITADKSLLYRFNLGYTDARSFRDHLFNEAIFLSPSLTWRPWDSTEVNLNYEYRHEDILFDSGIPVRFLDGNNRIPPISRHSQFSEPGSPDAFDYHLVDFNGAHRFNALNADWTVRNGFQYQRINYDYQEISSGPVRADGRTVNRFVFFSKSPVDIHSVFFDLMGKFQVWGTDHTVLVGWDYYDQERRSSSFYGSAGQDLSIDLYNPVLGRVNLAAIRAQPFDDFFRSIERWHGVYFQDQISLFDGRVHILGGGRYDWAERSSGGSGQSLSDIKLAGTQAEKFSPRVGVVFQPWSWLSLYGNYVESIGATSSGQTADNSPLPPQEAEQYEVGFKTSFWEDRLTSTVAFFHVTKTNLPARDPNFLDRAFVIPIGEARSRGIELDIAGQVTDRLSLIGTYAFTDAQITKEHINGGQPGDPLPGAPDHQGSLWAKYQVLPERFEIGSGVFMRMKSPGVNGVTVDAPGFVRWDAFAAYHMNLGKTRLTAQVNLNNILDKGYFHATRLFGGGTLFPAEPRTVMGSLRIEY